MAHTRRPTAVRSHHDVVVVGSRAAGAATAMLLARAGHDVAVVDRAQLPSDTTSTHSLVRGGVVQLSRWGLLDDVLDSGAPPVRSVLFQQYGDGATEPVRLPVKDKAGVDMMLAPRRYILDAILADAAIRAGATLLTGTTVSDVVRDVDGRVTGVLAHGADGSTRQLTARLVVGADGVRSRMARAVRSAGASSRTNPAVPASTRTSAGWPGTASSSTSADQAFAGVFPTHHGEAAVWLIRPSAQLASVLAAGAGRLGAWLQALRTCAPELAERVLGGTVSAPLRGSVGLPNHVRRAAGPGWALVGDAGYHRDPITGHGLTDAFRDAELLAEAADAVLRDRRRRAGRDDGLRAAARRRDPRHVPDHPRAGRLPPPERFAELQVELSRALDVEAEQLAARPVLTDAVPVC